MNSEPVIEISELSYSYLDQPVLENINLTVEDRDFMAIVGPNGGGKTTLLKLILGLLRIQRGNIKILGERPRQANRKIGYLPQYGSYDIEFPIKVIDVVMMSMLKNSSLLPWYRSSVREKALDILRKLQIENLVEKKLNELSGGLLQRVLIARALMIDPRILILDEPTSSVDSEMEKDIFDILKQLNSAKTIIVVSHDVSFVSTYVNKVTCLNRCACTHPTEEIRDASFMEIYSGSIKALKHHCEL